MRSHRTEIMVWAIFIVWEVVVIGLFSRVFGHPVTYLVHYLLIIGLFYLHGSLLLPMALKGSNRRIFILPLLLALEVSAFTLLSYVVDLMLSKAGFLHNENGLKLDVPYVMGCLYRGLYFLGFATGYYYLQTYLMEKKRAAELEKKHLEAIINRQLAEQEKISAQNAFLVAQINPHFFFNVLDFLYHNVREASPSSAEAISHLAEMTRFAMDANMVGQYIRLGDEIDQVKNLIYLNNLRTSAELSLHVDEAAYDLLFIPLVLLTLAENIFKHGDLRQQGSGAFLSVRVTGHHLEIATGNLVRLSRPAVATHHGLSNTANRLVAAYGDNARFRYGATAKDWFSVELSVPVNLLESGTVFSYQ